MAALAMWPVLRAPHQRVYGEPSDPLGEVWRLEQFRTGAIGLVGDTVAEAANAPDGVALRRAVDATQVLYDVPAWLLTRVLPAVLSYNLLVWLALWTTGLAAFWALRRLGVRPEGAAVAGLLWMLAPVHMAEARLHVGLALVGPLAVALLLGIAAVRRPTIRGGALFGAATAACGYVTAYLALEAAALALGIAVTAVAVGLAHRERAAALVRAGAAATVAALVVALPLVAVLATSRGALDTAVGRPASDLAAFSLAPRDYVDRDLSSYIGLVGVALALAGLAAGRGGRTLRWGLAAVTAAGAWVSLSPDAPLVGPIAPAEWIHAALPYWRVYGRAEIVAALGVAALAGLAVARLAGRGGRMARAGAAVLAALAVADVAREPPPAAADLGRPDPAAAWLAGARGAVAEYPLRGFDDYRLGPYLLRQMRHDRPLLNGAIAGTRSADLSEAAADGGAQAAAALALGGVDRVLVPAGGAVPAGLLPGPRFPGGSRGARVPAQDAPAIALARSALGGEPGPDGTPFRWLSRGAVLRVLTPCAGRADVRLLAVSHTAPRRARIGEATIVVGTAPTPVRVSVPVAADGVAEVPVTTTPPPAPLPAGDPRVAGIGVYALTAAAACGEGAAEGIG